MTQIYRKLTRRDLTNFDDIATDAVLLAMDRGGEGIITGNGHVRLRHPDRPGQTMQVTRHSDKSKQIVEQNLRRLFPDPAKRPLVDKTDEEVYLSGFTPAEDVAEGMDVVEYVPDDPDSIVAAIRVMVADATELARLRERVAELETLLKVAESEADDLRAKLDRIRREF